MYSTSPIFLKIGYIILEYILKYSKIFYEKNKDSA